MHKRNNWGRNKRGGRDGRGRGGRSGFHGHHQNKNLTQPEQLSEIEVGISDYLNDLDGFSGVIKARYSDFHVNEIDLDGEIAKFTETKIPEEFIRTKAPEVPKDCPIEFIGQEKWDKILEMMESKLEEDVRIRLDVTGTEKIERMDLHKKIKEIFREKIISSTVIGETDNKKFIELKKFNKSSDTKHHNPFEWPKNLGNYVHFLLYKESMDTMEAVLKISDLLRMPPSAYNYAGVKDRRAKTTQWFSVYKVEPFKLLIKTKCFRNLKIGNLKFKNEPLKLGQLMGNQFKIALRNVTADDEVIRKSMDALKENGFINYYGLQRFGNDKEVPTYAIGQKLLQGKWKEACGLILKLKKCEDPSTELSQAKKVYQETGDAKKALQKLNNSYSTLESKLLDGLASSGINDHVNALDNVPRNTRLLYLHSFQSLVWNNAVSKRIKLGLKPIVGDLVEIISPDKPMEVVEAIKIDDIKDETETKDAVEETSNNNDDDNDVENEKVSSVKILTKNDLEDYTIFDIVMPLPGYDIQYPENEIKDCYKEILAKYGLELEMPRQKVKTYSLSGSYRKILGKVEGLTWKTLKYNDPNDTLIRSDFEELLGHSEPVDIEDGKFKALVMAFKLPSSSYATMVLREILKMDTSNRSQTKLNNYHLTPPTIPTTIIKTVEPVEPVLVENSLLNNKDEFEAFKKAIFDSPSNDESTVKRKPDEDIAEIDPKKSKLDETEKDSGIKIQASLV